MSFSYFSTPLGYIKETLDNRKGNIIDVSKLNAWIRITSGVGNGMVILSNPSVPLFYAANAIYGGIGADSRGRTSQTATEGEGDEQKVVLTHIKGKEIEFVIEKYLEQHHHHNLDYKQLFHQHNLLQYQKHYKKH